MRLIKNLVAVLLLMAPLKIIAQKSEAPNKTNSIDSNFTMVESEAEYPGGLNAWRIYLQKNLNSDVAFNNNAPIGKYTASVVFIVSKDGSLSDVKPISHYGYGMEEEVVRVIGKSGKWIPAIQNKRPVNAYRKQPITFILDSDEFQIKTKVPYTLFANTENEINVSAKKIKPENLSLNISGATVKSLQDGRFIVIPAKTGRLIIEIVNSKKDDKQIGLASFEVN